MPKLKNIPDSRSPVFDKLHKETISNSEHNDCTVKALAIIFNLSYDVALMRMYLAGRKSRKGHTGTIDTYKQIGEKLGYTLTLINPDLFLVRYPNPFSHGMKTVTTLHPHKFNHVWADGKTYVFQLSGHVCAVVDGQVHDWSRFNALRVKEIWKVDRL